ncbi:helix-turn-helix transcriptional regulator [Achromobacter xylosoxidans]|jgi:AraC-like DNA-binding protein|uniref:Transcriptional regulator n=3 Tax=Alcaligenes xylosoxydans xylosoxydans TaxID=85698 RepID=A0A1R1JYP0_ALCXX|nr:MULTISPECIES: helix-turn-helix transcriptional regulator [Achromobacter]KOQ25179.1 transcriptional regulator [Achromobacter xylosoxidans]KOQ26480.1 transcriptional regulator [Achromobacter xylosoxidans]KOQ33928.1 transcriptional regulator [Achromobacter xylosoxidans]KOQ36576.1 transcriptional regulator [Achromobacter xylosoxidans]KOQ45341.1 transcriptional regulator [Achromobacter xylosoxidans]
MPIYTLPAVEDPDLVACPIVGMAIDTREHASDWHAHQRTQLLYQAEGGVTLYLADRVGQLAPLQAAWLPAGCVHRTAMQGTFAYRSLYFDVRAYPDLPREPAILDVNPLLRELIVRVTQWPSDAALDAPRQRLVGALLDELAAAPTAPLHLPMPRDRRLAPIARELLENPACPLSIDEWGRRVGASGRTLARVFLAETGLSFTRWRAQCRLLMARARLAEGASVTEVAHAVGYASDSAFIAMYRRAYGEPPGRRLRRRDPPP